MRASNASEALRATCHQQMRPVLMTCVAACVGLLPAAFSTAIGSQVQRPLAIVVVGGMLLAPILFLTVLPAAIGFFSRRRVPVTSEAWPLQANCFLDLGDRRRVLFRPALEEHRRDSQPDFATRRSCDGHFRWLHVHLDHLGGPIP